ncbi:plasmid mobilization relaxosome protein MobC, partial [Streptomyces sp. NPDC059373]
LCIRDRLSTAHALAQGGEGPAGSRTRARGNQPDLRHQGAPQAGPTSEPEPAFPDRRPRRRPYQPKQRKDSITARYTPQEKAEVTAAAKAANVFPAGFLADAGLAAARGHLPAFRANDQLDQAIDELAALRTQISRVGNNINQIARVYNTDGQPRPGELHQALAHLVRTLTRIDDAAHDLVHKRTR